MFSLSPSVAHCPASNHHPSRNEACRPRLLLYLASGLVLLLLAGCAQTQIQAPVRAGQRGESILTNAGPAPVGNYRAQSLSGDYAGYSELEQFIEQMVASHGFQRDYLYGLFSQAERQDWTLNYLAKSDKSLKSKPRAGAWTRYRAKFLDDFHITKGVEFARQHHSTLQRASRQYHVPEEYILAILAVETKFGGYLGTHRTIDALTTLSFDYPRRSAFYKDELEAFLVMSRTEGIDPSEPVGSFAGAMGLGQFMPSSFLRYAVDFDNDGRRDLWNPDDAIGSIANYFAQHGWTPGQPVVVPLADSAPIALEPGISSHYSLEEIIRSGGKPRQTCNTSEPVNLLRLRHSSYDQYLIGCPNFYTITRYNNSVHYAMAIHELAQAYKDRSALAKAGRVQN